MKKIVIAGGSGFIGNCIAAHFANKGYQITILSRHHHLDSKGIHYATWNAKTKGAWTTELEAADLLINLTVGL
ncbi:MAG: NAD-dependent epimerase/dehydratase family protein [Reichenbachiella sp.]